MKLNHVNLTVDDVPATRAFLEKYFGLRPMGEESQELRRVVRRRRPCANAHRRRPLQQVSYPKTFHIGFIQPTPEDVDEINQRLRDDGYDVEAPSEQHGAWTFYFECPGGFTIEVLC